MEFKPLYYKEKLNIINPEGDSGIVTLWSHPLRTRERLERNLPSLFNDDSPLVTLTSLYGNGLPQMLANLAYNPQVRKIAVVGKDINGTSFDCLMNFLRKGVTLKEIGGVEVANINGTSFSMDSQLKPELFDYLEVERFPENALDSLTNFLSSGTRINLSDLNRFEIELRQPEFRDFPSDITSHQIIARKPLEAWLDVVYRLDRFGKNVLVPKRTGSETKRTLLDVKVVVQDPSFEDVKKLKKFGFDPEELKKYQRDILDGKIPEGANYGYGNRMRMYWGGDTLEKVSSMLSDDSGNRHCLVSLWDSKGDLLERKASPCFTDAYFVKHPSTNELIMISGFRTHNAASAWLFNLYGLRAVQEKVAKNVGLEPGQINVRSRWLSLDPDNPKTQTALGLVKNFRKIPLNVHDVRGYYSVTADVVNNEIVVQHYSHEGPLLEEFRGDSAISLKNQLRNIEGFSNTDHAMWVGMELARAQYELEGSGK